MVDIRHTRLAWHDTSYLPDTVRETGEVIIEGWTAGLVHKASVTLEVLDNDDGETWIAQEGEEELPDGADWEDREPFEQAEDRLLTRLGMTRADLTDETDVPGSWM